MAKGAFQMTAVDTAGNVLEWPFTVTVRREVPGAPLARLYDADDNPLGNPLTITGSEGWAKGFFRFHTTGGFYRIDVAKGSTQAEPLRHVGIGTYGGADQGVINDPGYFFEFEDETTEPPSLGFFRANNADLSLATELYVSKTTRGGYDVGARLLELDPGGDTVKDAIHLRGVELTGASWRVDSADDDTDYVTLHVSGHDGSTEFVTDVYALQREIAGGDGASGAAGGGLKGVAIDVVDTEGGDPDADYEAGDTIDGVTLVAGMIVGRFTAGGNAADGLYVVQSSGTAPRHPDFDTWDKCAGALFPVMRGDTYADTLWRCTSDPGGGTIDSDPLVFVGGHVDLPQILTPAAPASGVRIYTKSDKKPYYRPAGGVETPFHQVGPGLSEPLSGVYRSETTMMIPYVAEVAMCGHFHRGRWEKASAPIFPAPASLIDDGNTYVDVGNGIDAAGNLLYEDFASVDTWYNIWATADDGDAAFAYKVTPSVCVGSVAGSVVTLNDGGENSYPYTPSAKTFQWSNDALIGVQVLVVTETIQSRANSWSGRIATITDNTNGTLTLDEIGGIDAGDFLILLPNTDHRCWLCDGYWEDNSINSPPMVSLRNIGTAGAFRRHGYMSNILNNWPSAGTTVSTNEVIPYAGNVSPLARSVIVDAVFTMSLSSSGNYVMSFRQDSGDHETARLYGQKVQTTIAETWLFTQVILAGSYGPWVGFQNAGNNIANVLSHSIGVRGWIY